MPTTVTTADLLVAPEELERASLGTLKIDVFEGTDGYDELLDELDAATENLESYLDRQLLIRPVTLHPYWRYDSDRKDYFTYVEAWPLHELADAGVSVESAEKGGQVIRRTTKTDSVAGYAGFRGVHHDLAALQGLVGLDGLTKLPPVLPRLLRRVIAELALVALDQRRGETLGGKRTTQFLPGGNVTSEGYRASADSEILKRAHDYRRVSI